MQSHQSPLAPSLPRDRKGRQIKRTSGFLLGQLIFSLVGAPLITPFAHAQTGTTCTGGDSCIDLYQGTISAIQAYGYQPPSLTNANASLYLQSFEGGVLNGGTMAFTQNGGTPGTDTINSVFVWNCPDAPAPVSGTVYATVTVTNSSTLSSDTSVSNTNSSFNQGTNTVSLSYQTPPSPYGSATASDVMSYTWGSSTTNSSTSSSSSTTTDSSSSTTSIPVQYNLAPGQATTVQITLDTTVYSGDSWSAPVSLSTTTQTLPQQSVPLSNLQYTQMFPNYFAPNTTVTVSDNGTSVNGNAWFGPVSWTCSPYNGGCAIVQTITDPSGQYTYWPTQYATIGGWGLTGPGTEDQIYWSGQSNGNTYQGMVLYYNNTQVDGSYLYGINPTTEDVVWNPKVTEYGSLALLENGNLVALNGSNAVVWSSNAGQGVKTPSLQAVPSNSIPTPQQLLGSTSVPTLMVDSSGTGYTTSSQNVTAFAFYATGSYSSNSYDNTGTAGTTGNAAMTSSQISQYCPNGSKQSGSQNLNSSVVPGGNAGLTFAANDSDHTPEEAAGYTLSRASFGLGQQGSYQVAQNDVRRDLGGRELERGREAPRSEGVTDVNDVDRQRNVPPQDKAIKRAVEGDGKVKKLVKVKYIKGPIVLRPNQFYASSSPGVKVLKVVVDSDNMTNFSGFAPGDSQAMIDPKASDSRKVELKVGHQLVTNVKPRPGI